MDPIVIPTLTAILSALVGGAAGEAGKNAWESLAALVRRRFGGDRRAVAAVERPDAVEPGDLARLLAERAAADPEFHGSLERWMAEAGSVTRGGVVNVNSGTVSGTLVQARDVHGSINIGADPRR